MDDMPARLFTVAEADAVLPTVKAQLERIGEARARLVRTAAELEELEHRRDRGNILQLAPALREARERLGSDREALRAAIGAITDQGIQIKGIDPPLLDFPAWRDGRVVLLCWLDGEPSVGHWHDLDAGFGGRKPL